MLLSEGDFSSSVNMLLPLVSLLNSVNECPLCQLHHILWEPLKISGLSFPSSANLCAGFFGVSVMPVLAMASLTTCLPKFSSAAELHTDCWRSWGLESPEWLLIQDDKNEASGLSGESAKEELASKTFAWSHAFFAFSPCEMQSPHLCCSLGRTSLINYLHVNSYLRANL